MFYGVIKKSNVAVLGLFSAALLLGGCGADDSQSSASNVTASSESAPVVLDGGAIKGVISQGQVTAWSLEQPPGSDSIELGSTISKTVMTDSQGRFRLPLDKGADGWIMVELTAGNGTIMTCDVMPTCQVGAGKTVDFGNTFPVGSDFRLRAAVNLDTGNEIYLTPLSSLAVASAEQMDSGLTGENLQTAYTSTEVSFDLKPGTLQLPPPDIARLNGFKGSTDAVQLAVINAAFLSLVDGKKWKSIEQVLKASEDLVRREGRLPETGTGDAPAVRDLVMEAAEQSVEIGLRGNIDSQSALASLAAVADRNMAYSREIDGEVTDSTAGQVVGNTDLNSNANETGDYGNDYESDYGVSGNGGTDSNNNDSGKLVTIGGGDKAPEFEDVAAGAAQLSWSAPLTRVNGDSISMAELEGYEIVYGRDADKLTQTISVPSNGIASHQYTVENLDSGKWYFAIRVVDTDGLSSTLSDVVSKSI